MLFRPESIVAGGVVLWGGQSWPQPAFSGLKLQIWEREPGRALLAYPPESRRQPRLAAPHCGKPQTENGVSGEVFWWCLTPKYLEETP